MSTPSYVENQLTTFEPGRAKRSEVQGNDNELQARIRLLRADVAQAAILMHLTGRIVGNNLDEGMATAGTGLTARVVNETAFIVEGVPLIVNDGLGYFLIDLTAYPSQNVYVYAKQVNGALAIAAVTAEPDTTQITLGRPCLGKFTTTSSAVTVDDSAATKVRRYDALPAGGGSGEGDGAANATELPISATDSTDTKAYIDAKLAAIVARLDELEAAAQPADIDVANDNEIIKRRLLRLEALLAGYHPEIIHNVDSSIDYPAAGLGAGETVAGAANPDLQGSGTAVRDIQTGTIHS